MDAGNAELMLIHERIYSIRDRVFGQKPPALGDPKEKVTSVAPVNFSYRLRSALDYNQKMQNEIYELLTEIENFI